MLWGTPRSRSTAFFRMMAERGDFTVVHEPFSYLAEFGYTDVAGERVTSAPGALTWAPADRPEWQPSRRWHAGVAASTGFARGPGRPDVDVDGDPVLSGYLRHHLPFYEELHAQRLT